MPNSPSLLDQQFLEMRWRCLSLAADFDRLQRTDPALLRDARLSTLRKALQVLLNDESANRAERVQMLFSDLTPAPSR